MAENDSIKEFLFQGPRSREGGGGGVGGGWGARDIGSSLVDVYKK